MEYIRSKFPLLNAIPADQDGEANDLPQVPDQPGRELNVRLNYYQRKLINEIGKNFTETHFLKKFDASGIASPGGIKGATLPLSLSWAGAFIC